MRKRSVILALMVMKENHRFMIKKGGTAEYFGPLRDGKARLFYSLLIENKYRRRENYET